jgi:sulfur transfer complex TusBCD TusB component (DsrH family)
MQEQTPQTRQDFLAEVVETASKITDNDIKNVLSSIVRRAEEESRKTQAYAAMFEASHEGLRGILDQASSQMTRVVLDTMDVLTRKGLLSAAPDDYVIRNRVYYMLEMLPVMCTALEYDIDAREGWSCVKDKVRHLVYETFMDIMGLPIEQDQSNKI